jgi:hypothetical protein
MGGVAVQEDPTADHQEADVEATAAPMSGAPARSAPSRRGPGEAMEKHPYTCCRKGMTGPSCCTGRPASAAGGSPPDRCWACTNPGVQSRLSACGVRISCRACPQQPSAECGPGVRSHSCRWNVRRTVTIAAGASRAGRGVGGQLGLGSFVAVERGNVRLKSDPPR